MRDLITSVRYHRLDTIKSQKMFHSSLKIFHHLSFLPKVTQRWILGFNIIISALQKIYIISGTDDWRVMTNYRWDSELLFVFFVGFAPFCFIGLCEWCNMEDVFQWIATIIHCGWRWWQLCRNSCIRFCMSAGICCTQTFLLNVTYSCYYQIYIFSL